MNLRTKLAISIFHILGCTIICLAEEQTVTTQYAGFGFTTPAGSGGKVMRVTNLDAEGPGSLRAALEESCPRVVVFEVGGILDLAMKNLSIKHPFITVAGQTAPSPGITIIRGGIHISTHDVLLQHIRVRPGDAGQPKRSGWEPDGISTNGAKRVIIEHCSVTWAVDENISASGPRLEGPEATSGDITIRHCLNAEALRDASHKKGPHSMGTLVHDYCQNISVLGSFYAHNVNRNPFYKAHTTGVVVNNVIYNPRDAAVLMTWPDSEWENSPRKPGPCQVSVIGNVFIGGTDTKTDLPLIRGGTNGGHAYVSDNLHQYADGNQTPLTGQNITLHNEPLAWIGEWRIIPASETIDYVINNAGARPKERDAIDKRIIADFTARQGRIIDSQDEVGGYPAEEAVHEKLNIPVNNIDAWLASRAAAIE